MRPCAFQSFNVSVCVATSARLCTCIRSITFTRRRLEEVVAFGDAVLIAVPYMALPAIAQQVGEKLKGKVVIDPNNPVPSRDGEMAVAAKEKGAAVSTAALLPGARLA